MKLLEKEFERPQRTGMWLVTNNVDSDSVECSEPQYGLQIIIALHLNNEVS